MGNNNNVRILIKNGTFTVKRLKKISFPRGKAKKG